MNFNKNKQKAVKNSNKKDSPVVPHLFYTFLSLAIFKLLFLPHIIENKPFNKLAKN